MNQKLLNKQELDEALSDLNKYYFWKIYGRPHESVDELLNYYVVSEGCRDFISRCKELTDGKTEISD